MLIPRLAKPLVLSFAIVCAALMLACGGGDDDDDVATATSATTPTVAATEAIETPTAAPVGTPGVTPSPTPEPSFPDCPVDDEVCGAARALRTLLLTDVAAVAGGAEPVTVTCGGTPAADQLDPNEVLCEGAEPGEMRTGYQVAAWQSEGSTIPESELPALLEEWTEAGPLEMTTIGCPTGADGQPDCATAFAVVFMPTNGETLYEFIMRREADPVPRPAAFVTGVVSLNRPVVNGGVHELALPYLDTDGGTTTYFLYRPQ